MLSRFISKPSNLRFLTSIIRTQKNPNPIFPKPPISAPSLYFFPNTLNFYSTNRNNGNNDGRDSSISAPHIWDLSSETDSSIDSIFGEDSEITKGIRNEEVQLKNQSKYGSWMEESSRSGNGIEEVKGGDGGEELATGQEFKPWSLAGDEKEDEDKLFELGAGEFPCQGLGGVEEALETKKTEEEKQQLQEEEKIQTAILEGPNRAFGDLISASGITEDMLDSFMALKDLEGIEGLPPLRDIEDRRYEKTLKTNTRAEIERQKQEEIAKARVRQVDEKGRAYGTGRRKCSIARVWVQPGDGRFLVNDKEFDVYFPMLDNRAALLRPFSETKTLGQWDVKCTVKGGGVSGQVGAIQLGISRALQNWAPDMRPPLREAGFLTRDSRVVERKKPGKAKARKSFQWVKR